MKESLREAEMRVSFGWSRTSDMPNHSIHLASADVGEGRPGGAAKLKDRLVHKPAPQSRICLCGQENLPTSEYCEAPACGRPLTERGAERRERAALDAVLGQLERDSPAFQRLAEDLLKRALARPGRDELARAD